MGKPAPIAFGQAGSYSSGWRAAGKRGNQVHLVGIVENLLRVGLTPVDHEENGIVATREGKAVEQFGQCASGRERHVKTAQ